MYGGLISSTNIGTKYNSVHNTDIIIPFRFKSRTNDPYELAKYAMYGYDPDFHKKISKDDIIVAGRNFGGGSSREQAPVALKYAGISVVIAEVLLVYFTGMPLPSDCLHLKSQK